jgi:hypothetical protein
VAAAQHSRDSCAAVSECLCISIWHLRISFRSNAHERRGICAASSENLLSSDWAPFKQRRCTNCGATLYKRSSVRRICTALIGQLHCSVGHIWISVCGIVQHTWGYCSAASTQLCIIVGHSRWYSPSQARAQAFSRTLWLKQAFKHLKCYARSNNTCFNTNNFPCSLKNTKTYMQAHLMHAFMYNGWLVRKLACLPSYSDSYGYNPRIENSYTWTDGSTDTSFNKSIIQTRTLACTLVRNHVLLHGLTPAETQVWTETRLWSPALRAHILEGTHD